MLSILIVNWNTRDLLRRCLESLSLFPCSEPVEVIVVDNASSDGSAEMIRNDFPHIHLIASAENSGFAAGNNRAFRASTGDLVLLLNPDVEFIDDSLNRAIQRMRHDSNVRILAPKLILDDGSTQASVRGFPSLSGLLGAWTGWGRKRPDSIWDSYYQTGFNYNMEVLADQPMATFLLFHREDLTDPLFDPQFPIFFNEVDLLYKLKRIGIRPTYSPHYQVRHFGGASTRQVKPMMVWESHRSLVRYLRKHLTGWRRWLLPLWSIVIYGGAFARTRTVHPGFGTQRYDL